MKSLNIKSLFEMFGIVAIFLSLTFLGYELKRGNDIAEAEATATVYQGVNDFLLAVIADQNTRQVLRDAFGIPESVPDDLQILRTTMTYVYNIHEVAWKYHQKGLISDEDLAAHITELCFWITGSPAVAENWANRRDSLLPGFYEHVSRECKITIE